MCHSLVIVQFFVSHAGMSVCVSIYMYMLYACMYLCMLYIYIYIYYVICKTHVTDMYAYVCMYVYSIGEFQLIYGCISCMKACMWFVLVCGVHVRTNEGMYACT